MERLRTPQQTVRGPHSAPGPTAAWAHLPWRVRWHTASTSKAQNLLKRISHIETSSCLRSSSSRRPEPAALNPATPRPAPPAPHRRAAPPRPRRGSSGSRRSRRLVGPVHAQLTSPCPSKPLDPATIAGRHGCRLPRPGMSLSASASPTYLPALCERPSPPVLTGGVDPPAALQRIQPRDPLAGGCSTSQPGTCGMSRVRYTNRQ